MIYHQSILPSTAPLDSVVFITLSTILEQQDGSSFSDRFRASAIQPTLFTGHCLQWDDLRERKYWLGHQRWEARPRQRR